MAKLVKQVNPITLKDPTNEANSDLRTSNASKQPLSKSGPNVKPVSYTGVTSNDPKKYKSNSRRLECSNKSNRMALTISMKVVEEVNTRFDNALYGYFLGKQITFPVVDYYVRNVWAKYGIQKVIMNAKGFFLFKFTSKKSV
jgi:hypothetical protein